MMVFQSNMVLKGPTTSSLSNKLIIISLLLFTSVLHSASLTNAQSNNYSRKAASFKATFMESSRYCSNIYNTQLVDIIPMFGRSEIDNMQVKCFLRCMLERYQMVDKRGALNRNRVDRFLNSMPDSKFKASLKSFKEQCLKEDAQNQCQKAYKFSRCFFQNGADKKRGN